jgi:hypothetical protein
MRTNVSVVLVASALALGASLVHAQQAAPAPTVESAPAPQVDATLDSMRGGTRRLRDERGRRVVVLFFCDRPHVDDNNALKGGLRRFVDDNQLNERVAIYGVADLESVGSVPETLVRTMIQPVVDRWNIDILLDWQGVMRRAPFNFPTYQSTIAILDREGRITWRREGELDATGTRDFYRALRTALR